MTFRTACVCKSTNHFT